MFYSLLIGLERQINYKTYKFHRSFYGGIFKDKMSWYQQIIYHWYALKDFRTIYNFAVIYPWNLLFSLKVAFFLIVYILSCLFIIKTSRFNKLKTRAAINVKISVFVSYVEVIIRLLLYNLRGCTLKINVITIFLQR